jgi:hypothetical protein
VQSSSIQLRQHERLNANSNFVVGSEESVLSSGPLGVMPVISAQNSVSRTGVPRFNELSVADVLEARDAVDDVNARYVTTLLRFASRVRLHNKTAKMATATAEAQSARPIERYLARLGEAAGVETIGRRRGKSVVRSP